MICFRCGYENNEKWKFCYNCRKSLITSNPHKIDAKNTGNLVQDSYQSTNEGQNHDEVINKFQITDTYHNQNTITHSINPINHATSVKKKKHTGLKISLITVGVLFMLIIGLVTFVSIKYKVNVVTISMNVITDTVQRKFNPVRSVSKYLDSLKNFDLTTAYDCFSEKSKEKCSIEHAKITLFNAPPANPTARLRLKT